MISLAKKAKNKARRILLRKTTGLRSSLRAGIVGCGAISSDHIYEYEVSGLAHVVAVNDVSPLSFSKTLDHWPFIKAYKDLRQMLKEQRPDVVSICTWPQSHAEIVAEVAAEGVKGILCEKPLTLQLGELDAMLEACSRYGCKLAGGHQYRFHRFFRRAERLVREGRLGKIKHVSGNATGSLANTGPHLIDTIAFLLGDPKVSSVRCDAKRIRNEWNRGIPAEDGCIGTLTFDNGVECSIKTGDEAEHFFSVAVLGDQGSIEVTADTFSLNGETIVDETAGDDCRKVQFREFLEWIKGSRSSYSADVRSSADTVHTMLALYESVRLGRLLNMPLKNKGDVIRQLYPASTNERAVGKARIGSRSVKTNERLASEGGNRAVQTRFKTDPDVGISELVGLTRVILSKNMNAVGGTEVRAFEREFAAAYGSEGAVASTSGTAAIHVAVGAINPEPCDEIITTPITDMGTVIPILTSNCIPVFADVDAITGNMTAESIEKKITPKTKAVILVHLFGHSADIDPILEVLRPRGIPLIEDCSQAHYADYRGKKVGTYGDFGCFSLQQSKQMTCGDGGITLVNRKDLLDRARLFVDKGWNRGVGLRTHLFLGMNYRMTELQAAVARAQLRKLPRLIEQRQTSATQLNEKLRQISPFLLPRVASEGTRPAWWMYPFTINQTESGIDIDEFYQELAAEGVRIFREYVPQAIFSYPILKDQRTYGESRYPFSATSYTPPEISDFPGFLGFKRNLLYLDWHHTVTPKHVASIGSAVEKVFRALRSTAAKNSSHARITEPEPVLGNV